MSTASSSSPAPLGRYSALALVLILAGLCYLHAIRPQHHWGGDFSVYVSQARNVWQGHPLYQSTYVVTPQSAEHHPAAYPPVPSLLIAPVFGRYGLNYQAFKLTLGLLTWFSLPFWYLAGLRMGLSFGASLGCVFVFSLGFLLFPILDNVGSDGVYLLWAAASLWSMLYLEQEGWAVRWPLVSALWVSVLLLLAVATRAAGFALVAAFGLNELARMIETRGLRAYAWWTAGMTGLGLVLYQLYLYNTAEQYGNQFSLNVRIMVANLVYYLRSAAPLWSPAPTPLRYLLAGAVLVLGVWAWLRRLPRWGAVEFYLLASVGMLCVYTVNNDARYAVPILPVLLFLAAEQLSTLGRRWMPSRPALPLAALGALAGVAITFNLVFLDRALLPDAVGRPAFQQVAGFLERTPADTLILSWNPRVFALYSGHPSALYPQDAGDFESQIPPAAHVLLVRYAQPLDEEKLGAYLAQKKPPVEFSNAEFQAYRIR